MLMDDNNATEVRVDENTEGTVSFAPEVVATIAGLAANEVDGVASMSSASSGLADILSRKSSRNYTRGVKIDIDDNKVTVDITIVVEYGSPVPDVARGIQENVKKAIETMAGLDVRNVDVHVQGVSFERENKAAAELDEQQRKLIENSAQTAEPEAVPELDDALDDEEIEEEDFDFDVELPEIEEDEQDEADEEAPES